MKRVSRQSLLKPTGSNQPLTGAGERSTGRAKLNPTNGMKTVNRKTIDRRSTSAAPLKGNRGPKRT